MTVTATELGGAISAAVVAAKGDAAWVPVVASVVAGTISLKQAKSKRMNWNIMANTTGLKKCLNDGLASEFRSNSGPVPLALLDQIKALSVIAAWF